MNLGGNRYRKIQVRSEQSRRFAKLRASDRTVPTSPPGRGVEVSRRYLDGETGREDSLKRAGIFAILFHFFVFLLVMPDWGGPEVLDAERSAGTVVKRYTPPAPPQKQQKQKKKKKKATVVPIPDPTPEDPEPIEPEEGSDYELGEFDDEYVVGVPDGLPGALRGARDGAFRAGEGGIASPVVLRQVDPEYTPEATRRGIQGEVWIEAVVDVDGRVIEPRLLRGLPDEELNRRAMEAIQRWQFKPGMKDGLAVPVIAVFTVTYRLH
jgi:protein TonB